MIYCVLLIPKNKNTNYLYKKLVYVNILIIFTNNLNEKIMTTTESLLEKLNPVIEIATQMLLNGVLSKNVIKHFTNKGWSLESANNICELAIFRGEQMNKNKIK